MSETVHRVLRLLSLLEARATWTGPELASRLGVTVRTVRRDVEKLRSLGYPVEGERGLDGGYRLGPGRRLPPLLLDDDEAVALVACLRMAATEGDDATGEAALRALTKLERVLPPQVRVVAESVHASTVSVPSRRPAVDAGVLSGLARAVAERVRVRFAYTAADGASTQREAEPARLVTRAQVWYLQAFDRDRDDWRTFRLDRVRDLHLTTFRAPVRTAPPLDDRPARPVVARWPCVAQVRLAAAPDAVAARLPAAYRDDPVPTCAPDGGCTVRVGGPDWPNLAWHLQWVALDLGAGLVVDEPDALREALAAHAAAFGASARS